MLKRIGDGIATVLASVGYFCLVLWYLVTGRRDKLRDDEFGD